MNKAKQDNEDRLAGLMLLPAKPGTCPECATAHESGEPHNQGSLYCQYAFYGKNGRWPTWGDALAHCDEEMQDQWKQALRERGVEVG